MFCLGLGILCGEFYNFTGIFKLLRAFSFTLKVASSTIEHEEGFVFLSSVYEQMLMVI